LIVFLIQSGPVGWAILAVLIVVVFFIIRKTKTSSYALNKISYINKKQFDQLIGYQQFIQNNPDFLEGDFKKKVEKAFIDIQYGWSNNNLSKVRKFISDGVYQRFNTQFKMMGLLKQKDTITYIHLISIGIDRIENDGLFDILHVAVQADINDQFVCEKNPSLNSPGGMERFTEYWSFIKKRGKQTKDIYSSNLCPNCGSQLPENMADAGQCAYCKTFVNSGEYDWVLSEITQTDDYLVDKFITRKIPDLKLKIQELIHENQDLSIQQIEDKASNGYLQILTSQVFNDPAIMRRFVSDQLFEKLKARFQKDSIVYNRLYLNAVSLIGAMSDNVKNILFLGLRTSFQRVRLNGDGPAVTVDYAVLSKEEVIIMSRDIITGESKGSLYARHCSSCGAAIKDSLEIKCSFCGSLLNSGKNEWIITDILSPEEYQAYYKENSKEFDYAISSSIRDLYQIRDYAFNNILMMASADKVFAEKERDFVSYLARKWGYDPKKLEPWFEMAKAGQLSIRMPDDPKKRKKIFDLMMTTAKSDEFINPEEQALIDTVKSEYGL